MLERLPILVLQPHNRCNCRCVMCDIWKLTDAQEISAAELERHLADIERLGVEWVVFTGGEPLMHSDLFRLSATAARARHTHHHPEHRTAAGTQCRAHCRRDG